MRVLICSSNGGQGLMAGSEALKECIMELDGDSSVVILDFPKRARSFSRMLVNDVYNLSLRMNISLSTLYVQIGELLRFHRWGPALENVERVREVILREDPDIVVITSPWVSRSITRALQGTEIPVFSVVLDFGESLPSGWACGNVARCIAPTDTAMEELIRNGMEGRVLKKVGILVHPRFLRTRDTAYDEGRVLVLSGREGCSNSYHVVKALLSTKSVKGIDVLCGSNSPLRRRVEALGDQRIHAYGYVDDILPFYQACQLVISKAGSFTVAECLAMNRPLIVDATHGIMRQEMGNVQLVQRSGIGTVIRELPEMAQEVESLVEDSELYESYSQNIKGARKMLDPYGVAREILRGESR